MDLIHDVKQMMNTLREHPEGKKLLGKIGTDLTWVFEVTDGKPFVMKLKAGTGVTSFKAGLIPFDPKGRLLRQYPVVMIKGDKKTLSMMFRGNMRLSTAFVKGRISVLGELGLPQLGRIIRTHQEIKQNVI